MAFDTADNLINDAAVELGLITSNLADPFDSTNPALIQLCRLGKRVGQTLLRSHQWTHLQKTHTFSTANGTAAYALPADFGRLLDQTTWNRTDQLPLGGPASAQQWQMMKAQTTVGTVLMPFRIVGNQLEFYPVPTAIETIAYEYQSTYWVKETGQSNPNTETLDDGTDTVHFDRLLFVCELKNEWNRAKGLASEATQADRDRAYAMATGADGAAPRLRLGGGQGVRLLDWRNVPDTGYGS
jgi:hypothetical protein